MICIITLFFCSGFPIHPKFKVSPQEGWAQLFRDENYLIGFTASIWKFTPKSKNYVNLFICYIGPNKDIRGPMYEVGKTCSKCRKCTPQKLCGKSKFRMITYGILIDTILSDSSLLPSAKEGNQIGPMKKPKGWTCENNIGHDGKTKYPTSTYPSTTERVKPTPSGQPSGQSTKVTAPPLLTDASKNPYTSNTFMGFLRSPSWQSSF